MRSVPLYSRFSFICQFAGLFTSGAWDYRTSHRIYNLLRSCFRIWGRTNARVQAVQAVSEPAVRGLQAVRVRVQVRALLQAQVMVLQAEPELPAERAVPVRVQELLQLQAWVLQAVPELPAERAVPVRVQELLQAQVRALRAEPELPAVRAEPEVQVLRAALRRQSYCLLCQRMHQP